MQLARVAVNAAVDFARTPVYSDTSTLLPSTLAASHLILHPNCGVCGSFGVPGHMVFWVLVLH